MTESWHKPTREQRKKLLREQAEAQKAAWDQLTTMQKIEALDARLGPNVGAKKQRAKLKALLEKEHAAKEAKKKEAKAKKEKAETETEPDKKKKRTRKKKKTDSSK